MHTDMHVHTALPLMRQVTLTPPSPYDLALTLTALARYPRRVNRWDGIVYRRLFHLPEHGGAFVHVAVWQDGASDDPRLCIEMRAPATVPPAALDATQATLTRMLGAAEDISGFCARALNDASLGPLVRGLPGLRLFRKATVTEEVIVDILAQQISLPFAYQCKARLVAAYGPRLTVVDDEPMYAMPEAPSLATITPEAVRPLLISRQKAAALRAYGEAVTTGALDLATLPALSDADATAALTQVRGIGPWTAQWVLGRTLARGAIVPLGDVGVQAMLGALTGAGRKFTPVEVRTWADAWGSDALLALNYVIIGAWRGIRPA